MKHKCMICGETSEEQNYYSENGVDIDECICESCYLLLRKIEVKT